MTDSMATRSEVGPSILYHGTSIECAMKIQAYGFDASLSGTSSGELLGPGVYCTPVLMKAVDYAKSKPFQGVILELRCDLGNCKKLLPCDPMMKTWQQHEYDSACMPTGANNRQMAETCIKDATRITLVRVIAGNTWQLQRLGLCIRASDGRLSMIGDRASKNKLPAMHSGDKSVFDPMTTDVDVLSSQSAPKRKRQNVLDCGPKTSFGLLLRQWKLQDVEATLTREGVIDEDALMGDLEKEDINQLDIGTVFKRRIHKLVQHLSAQTSKRQKIRSDGLGFVGQMRRESHNAQALVCASRSLVLLLGSDADAIGAVVDDGILGVLITSMSHTKDVDLQQNLMILVAIVSAHSPGLVAECLEIVPALLISMNENTKDKVLVVRGVAILLSLLTDARRKEIFEQLLENGGLSLIIKIMHTHLGHFDLQSNMCQLLHDLAFVPAFLIAIIHAGGVHSVTLAMSTHWELAGKNEAGWRVLTRILSSCQKNAPMIIDKNGVGALLHLLAQRKKDAKLQERGNLLLIALAGDNYSAFALKFVSSNGVNSMAQVMKTHPSNASLLATCMMILSTICHSHENRAAIVAAGALDTALLAMKKPETCTHITLLACATQFVLNLSASDNLRIMMIENQVVALLVTVMTAQKQDSWIQQHSVGALYNLCADKPAYRELLMQTGGITAVLDAMTLHPSVTRLQQIACGLLNYTARDATGRASIVAKRGIALVLSAMKTYAENVPLQVSGVAILNKITFENADAQDVVLAAGALSVVILCMTTRKDHVALQLETMRFLHNLLAYPSRLACFSTFDAVAAIMTVMTVYVADTVICDLGIEILFQLSTSDQNLPEELKKCNAVPIISQLSTSVARCKKSRGMAQTILDTMAI